MASVAETVEAVYAHSRRGPLTAPDLFAEKVVIPAYSMDVHAGLAERMRQEGRGRSGWGRRKPGAKAPSGLYGEAARHIGEYVAQQKFATAYRDCVVMSEACGEVMGSAERTRDERLRGAAEGGPAGRLGESDRREFEESVGSAVNLMESIREGVRSEMADVRSRIAEMLRLDQDRAVIGSSVGHLTGVLDRLNNQLESALNDMNESVAGAHIRYSEKEAEARSRYTEQQAQVRRQFPSGGLGVRDVGRHVQTDRPTVPGPAHAESRVRAQEATATAAGLRSGFRTREAMDDHYLRSRAAVARVDRGQAAALAARIRPGGSAEAVAAPAQPAATSPGRPAEPVATPIQPVVPSSRSRGR